MTDEPGWRVPEGDPAGSVLVMGPTGRPWDRSTLLVEGFLQAGAAVYVAGEPGVAVETVLQESTPAPGPRLLLVSAPTEDAVRLVGTARLQGWTTVLDVDRPWTRLTAPRPPQWYDDSFVVYLARHVDVVTTVSDGLADVVRTDSGVDAVVLPNTCPPLPEQQGWVSAAGRDRTGSTEVGVAIPYWTPGFHWQTVTMAANGLAALLPGATVCVAAPAPPNGLSLPGTVQLLTDCEPTQALAQAHRWRAALVPLRPGPLATCADPVDVYACQALGVPVVATFVPALLGRPGVAVTESAQDLVEALAHPPRTCPSPQAGPTYADLARELLSLAAGDVPAQVGPRPAPLPGRGRAEAPR